MVGKILGYWVTLWERYWDIHDIYSVKIKLNLSQLLFCQFNHCSHPYMANGIVTLKTDTMHGNILRRNKIDTMATLIMVPGSEQPQK